MNALALGSKIKSRIPKITIRWLWTQTLLMIIVGYANIIHRVTNDLMSFEQATNGLWLTPLVMFTANGFIAIYPKFLDWFLKDIPLMKSQEEGSETQNDA